MIPEYIKYFCHPNEENNGPFRTAKFRDAQELHYNSSVTLRTSLFSRSFEIFLIQSLSETTFHCQAIIDKPHPHLARKIIEMFCSM